MKLLKRDIAKVLRGELTIDEAKRRCKLPLIKESKKLIREDSVLMSKVNPEMYENDSLDSQVDKLFVQGETQQSQKEMGFPKQTPAEPVGTALESCYFGMNLNLIMEAGEDDVVPPPTEIAQQDSTPESTQNNTDAENIGLDYVAFADNIARIVEKHESLLDIRGTIVRRALNWVTKNYDAKQTKEIKQILEMNFGITVDNNNDLYQDDHAPNAKGAGPELSV